ncbi:MAG: SpoIIE family protein phosphatase [Rhodocyclaceae bacterium]|nr:SpoIIE family protein phosphatase [Rhodocyclaceae bacterium]
MDRVSIHTLNILVADDEAGNVRLLEAFLKKQGHRVVVAKDGVAALEVFASARPDVVLLDVMMPGMNGFDVAARMRELVPDRWVPIVFLSALDGIPNMVKGLTSGGDDYMVKPVNLTLLGCKIRALQRVTELQANLIQRNRELETSRHEGERNLAIARHLFARLGREDHPVDARLRCRVRPANVLAGDVVVASLGADHKLRVMLADAAGYGLAAAVNVLPMVEIFQAMADKGFSLEAIARDLDRKLRAIFPSDRFVATALVCVNFQEQRVSVWNAGLPPVLLLDAAGKVVHEFISRALPCGLHPDGIDTDAIEHCQFEFGGQVAMFSDGLVETCDSSERPFGKDGLYAACAGSAPLARFEQILRAADLHAGGQAPCDDVALALIDLRPDSAASTPQSPWRGRTIPQGLGVALCFGPDSLRQRDNVPRIVAAVAEVAGRCDEIESLHLVLAEMFHNAVDHGLLGLDSDLKNEPDGFERYLTLRAQRLADLAQGEVKVEVAAAAADSGAKLCVTVTDSGPGFDFRQRLEQGFDLSGEAFHGRGISIIRMLAKRLEYLERGNSVRVWI